jgi:hypothetical protein
MVGILEVENWVILDVLKYRVTAGSLRAALCYVLSHIETVYFYDCFPFLQVALD